MKIFLTSQAANVLEQIFPSPPNNSSVLFIPTAADPYETKEWMDDDRNKLLELGFKVKDFNLKDKEEKEVKEKVSNTDVIFVAGGNTFYLLEKIRKSGFDKVLREFINQNKVYIGSSAGSVILGPNIEPMKYLDQSKEADITDYSGLNLVNFIVLPHFDNKKYDGIYKKLQEEYKNKYELKKLNDDEYLELEISGK